MKSNSHSLFNQQQLQSYSLYLAAREQHMLKSIKELEKIIPNISNQYSNADILDTYIQYKVRAQHSFQIQFLLDTLYKFKKKDCRIADIGDSSGNHMRYIKALAQKRGQRISAVSVNLDPIAIEKINANGGVGILCRAEDFNPEVEIGGGIDLFTSFQMAEHLHDPCLFFRRMAIKSNCNTMLITVPYVEHSRIGLQNSREKGLNSIYAEDEHIFELSPEDWKILMLHSGWKTLEERIYYQYPRNIPFISSLLKRMWKNCDYEGFVGFVLKKDLKVMNRYKDWDAIE